MQQCPVAGGNQPAEQDEHCGHRDDGRQWIRAGSGKGLPESAGDNAEHNECTAESGENESQ